MTYRELFRIWSPPTSIWSPWAKPVLFASMRSTLPEQVRRWAQESSTPTAVLPPLDAGVMAWLSSGRSGRTAVIMDLPGEQTVERALQMAAQGFCPVPLFNTTYGDKAHLPVMGIMRRLFEAGEVLARQSKPLSPTAPPVFMLDTMRNPPRLPAPGDYDNRWVVFPQDFPSADFLKRNGFTGVVYWRTRPASFNRDLDHVLIRWQDAGIAIFEYVDEPCSVVASPKSELPPNPNASSLPTALRVTRPMAYRGFWQRWLVAFGLRRSSAGGFGGVVPQPSSGGHG